MASWCAHAQTLCLAYEQLPQPDDIDDAARHIRGQVLLAMIVAYGCAVIDNGIKVRKEEEEG